MLKSKRTGMRRRFAVAFVVCLVVFISTPAPAVRVKPLPNKTWSLLLAEHVSEGRVDYAKIHQKPGPLDQCIEDFEKVSRQTYGKWTRSRQIAFWINAYNLFTIHSIIENYPPEGSNLLYPRISIRQIGRVWSTTKYRTAGQRVSLNQIAEQTLRLVFKDPRVHFALVPASLGGPPLSSMPYEGETLDRQLDQQVRAFLSDPEHGLRWDNETRTLYLSRIFLWYGSDFGYFYLVHKKFSNLPRDERSVINFVWGYISEDLRKSLTERPFKITFMDYDWSLNDLLDHREH